VLIGRYWVGYKAASSNVIDIMIWVGYVFVGFVKGVSDV